MHKKIFVLLISTTILTFTTFGCKKSEGSDKSTQTADESLPGYYNINFETIFTEKDNHSTKDALIKEQLNNYFTSIWQAGNLSGGLLVGRGNSILFEKYAGYINIETKTPITSTTPMHVASVSKIVTSLAILKLVEAGKIELSQKVTEFLPTFPYPNITIKELLSHRSGLSNYSYLVDETKGWDKSKKMTNQDVLNLYATFKPELQSQPDSHFSYSNTNFALLALIVEKVTKKPFPEALDKMIFKPLGMNHSYIFQEKNLATANTSYYAKGKPYPFDHLDLVYGDKNLYTTPEDLFRLSQAMYAPNFLRKDLLELMFTPYSNEKAGVKNYGLGIRMIIFDNGKKLIYHTGWWHGSNAIFVHLLDEKVTIIAIGNKYSRAIYSALRLSSLFGDYPLHLQEPDPNETNDSIDAVLKKVITHSEYQDKNIQPEKTKSDPSKKQ